MTSKLTREKVQWLHDAAEEAAAVGIKLTMKPDEILMFTSAILAAMDSEPVAWDYEWASYITCEGPQDFKRIIEREAPPAWAIEEGQARNIIPLYRHAQQPVVPKEWAIADAVKFCKETGRQDAGAAMDAWNACRTAIQSDNSPVIPDGYVMVPKEPTREMIWAAKSVMFSTVGWESFAGAYRAMLAAAPQEPKP